MSFDVILVSLFTFWGPTELFFRSGIGFEICFWLYLVGVQLLFSIVPSILTFDFSFNSDL